MGEWKDSGTKEHRETDGGMGDRGEGALPEDDIEFHRPPDSGSDCPVGASLHHPEDRQGHINHVISKSPGKEVWAWSDK